MSARGHSPRGYTEVDQLLDDCGAEDVEAGLVEVEVVGWRTDLGPNAVDLERGCVHAIGSKDVPRVDVADGGPGGSGGHRCVTDSAEAVRQFR